jgi:hypothetical protein
MRMMQEISAETSLPAPPPASPSRLTLWLRRSMVWAAGALVVFALGALGNWWFQVRPRMAQVQQLTAQLEAANQELEVLRPKAADADRLQALFDKAELRLLTLQALVRVNEARAALALGEGSRGRLPALLADAPLARLQTLADPAVAETVGALRERLAMAIDEIEGNAFAAQGDFEILANGLNQLANEFSSAE